MPLYEFQWREAGSETLLGYVVDLVNPSYVVVDVANATDYEWRARVQGSVWSAWQPVRTLSSAESLISIDSPLGEISLISRVSPTLHVELSDLLGAPSGLFYVVEGARVRLDSLLGIPSVLAKNIPILETLIELDSLLGIPLVYAKNIPILETRLELNSPLEEPVGRIRYLDIPPIPAEISLPGVLGSPNGLIFKRAPPSDLLTDLVIWPFGTKPPLKEVLEWKTDIAVSRNGTEHAARLVNAPRKSLEIISTIFPENSEWANNLIRNAPDKKWGVLDWSEPFTVTIPEGAFNLPIRGNPPESGLVILWKSPTQWVIRSFVRTNSLELDEPIYGNWSGATMVQVLVGRILQHPTVKTVGYSQIVRFIFQSDYNSNIVEEIADYSLVPHYKNIDVYTKCPIYTKNSGVEDRIIQKEDIFDSETGELSRYMPWECPRQKRTLIMYQGNILEVQKFKEWLYRRAGRYRTFYMPTWTKDLIPSHVGLVGFYLDVQYVEFNFCHRDLAVRLKNNCWILREVESVEEIGESLRIRFIVPINIDVGDIERVCYLRQYALATDRVEIRHDGGFHSEVVVPIQETVRAKPPPIHTTTLYFIQDSQDFFMEPSSIEDGSMRALVIYYTPDTVEELDTKIDVVELELRQIRMDYIVPEEVMDVSISIDSLLTEPRIDYSMSVEKLDVMVSVTGLLTEPRLDYTQWPVESFDTAIELIESILEEPV